MQEQIEKKSEGLLDVIKRLLSLYIETIKLTSAEKITILFSAIALFAVIAVFTVLALIFIAIGLSSLLEAYIAPFWSYFIIAGILILLIAVTIVFKKQFIIDPIARFISKLLLTPPSKKTYEHEG